MANLQGEWLPLVVGMYTQQLRQASRSAHPPRGSTEQEPNDQVSNARVQKLDMGKIKAIFKEIFLKAFLFL